MKALVIIGCAGRTYVDYLKAAHPQWDVRAVVPPQADAWLKEGHEGYLGFLKDLDVFIGQTRRDGERQHIRPDTVCVPIPAFTFFGHQPDAMLVPGLVSPLKRGLAHSRIAAAAWLTGQSQAQAEARFTAEHYQKLGYFETRTRERQKVIKAFAVRDFDVTALLDAWLDRPGLFWYPAHPRVAFFFEIVRTAMQRAGFEPEASDADLDALRDAMPDYLGDGVHWPVYPEIAAHHEIAALPSKWRSSAAKDQGEEFGLTDMISRSYAIYEADPAKARAALEKAFKTPESVARHAGQA